MVGEAIGSWKVVDEIGRGGMGVVYRARHLHLPRSAAIKILTRDLAANPEALARFFDEARAASLVEHPGIVAIHDCGMHQGESPFIVMELLDGVPLSVRLREQGALSVGEAATLGCVVADALAATHRAGIVHRDLKPDNLFLCDGDIARVKILDFGIAKLLRKPEGGDGAVRTVTGVLMGTPRYMSPEQCRGPGTVDHRTDIYSLGCILFEAVAGRPPFAQEGYGELVAAHLVEPPPRLAVLDSSVPPTIDHLVDAMLAKAPDKRPQNMAEVRTALAPFATGREPSGAARASSAERSGRDDLALAPTALSTARGWRRRRIATVLGGFGLAAGLAAGVLVIRDSGPAAPGRTVSPGPTGSPPQLGARVLPPAPSAAAQAPDPLAAPSPEGESAADNDPEPEVPILEDPPTARRPTETGHRGPRLVKAEIRSEPSWASVCLTSDRRVLGKTPLSFQHRMGPGGVRLYLHKPGHAAAIVTVSPTQEPRPVKLRRLSPDDLEEAPCRRTP